MKKIFGLVLLTSMVAPFAFAHDDEERLEPVTVMEVRQEGNLMPVRDPKRGNPVTTTLTLNVQSGGCTKAEDFELEVEVVKNGNDDDVQEVTVHRLRPDGCEAYFRDGADVQLVTKKLVHSKDIVVRNPLLVHTRFTH